jgi:hypothetical protein
LLHPKVNSGTGTTRESSPCSGNLPALCGRYSERGRRRCKANRWMLTTQEPDKGQQWEACTSACCLQHGGGRRCKRSGCVHSLCQNPTRAPARPRLSACQGARMTLRSLIAPLRSPSGQSPRSLPRHATVLARLPSPSAPLGSFHVIVACLRAARCPARRQLPRMPPDGEDGLGRPAGGRAGPWHGKSAPVRFSSLASHHNFGRTRPIFGQRAPSPPVLSYRLFARNEQCIVHETHQNAWHTMYLPGASTYPSAHLIESLQPIVSSGKCRFATLVKLPMLPSAHHWQPGPGLHAPRLRLGAHRSSPSTATDANESKYCD